MSSNAKPMKRWLKWTLGTVLGLILLVVSGIGYLNTQQAKQNGEVEPALSESDQTAVKSATTKNQIHITYNSKLGALQADCLARSNVLLSELISDIKQKQANGEQISVDLLQNTYVPMIESSESHCDQPFSSMLVNAKKEYKEAGLNPAELDAWQFNYNAAKEQARSKALSLLSSLLAEK